MADDIQKEPQTRLDSDSDPRRNDEEEMVFEDEETTPDLVKKLRAKLRQTESDKQQYLEGWQRAKADYVNYKKEEAGEREKTISYATERLLRDLLGVLDSFEMAFASKEWQDMPATWRGGMEGIHKSLLGTFSKHGVEIYKGIGEPFDPSLYEAVGEVPVDSEKEDHTVVEVLQPGYRIKDKVIRPARVKVGKFTT